MRGQRYLHVRVSPTPIKSSPCDVTYAISLSYKPRGSKVARNNRSSRATAVGTRYAVQLSS